MKTIEEAINEISNQILSGMDKDSYSKDEIGDMFDKILMYVHSLPLAERLTAEEGLSIKIAYDAAKRLYDATNNPNNAEIFRGQYLLLESIFGKEMFAEEGGEK